MNYHDGIALPEMPEQTKPAQSKNTPTKTAPKSAPPKKHAQKNSPSNAPKKKPKTFQWGKLPSDDS